MWRSNSPDRAGSCRPSGLHSNKRQLRPISASARKSPLIPRVSGNTLVQSTIGVGLPAHEPSPLQTTSDQPLYRQLVDWLRVDLATKAAGDRIDSEPQMAKRFGVSRFTVTRAIEILVDEGLVNRRQGLGSFVAAPPLKRTPSYLLSFTEAVLSQGRLPRIGSSASDRSFGEKVFPIPRARLLSAWIGFAWLIRSGPLFIAPSSQQRLRAPSV